MPAGEVSPGELLRRKRAQHENAIRVLQQVEFVWTAMTLVYTLIFLKKLKSVLQRGGVLQFFSIWDTWVESLARRSIAITNRGKSLPRAHC